MRLVLLTDQQPKLIAGCMLLDNYKPEFQLLVSRHHIGLNIINKYTADILNISNVLVDCPYRCGCVVCVSVVATVL